MDLCFPLVKVRVGGHDHIVDELRFGTLGLFMHQPSAALAARRSTVTTPASCVIQVRMDRIS